MFSSKSFIVLSYESLVFEPGFPSKKSSCSAGDSEDMGLIPESGRSPGGGNGN